MKVYRKQLGRIDLIVMAKLKKNLFILIII